MTVLMHDAYGLLGHDASSATEKGTLFDVLYADDTLLIGSMASQVDELARAVEEAGATMGMSLHWGKTQAMSIATHQRLTCPDGTEICDSDALMYLGGLLSRDSVSAKSLTNC